MSQDFAVHRQDAGDVTTNEVAHDQGQTHRQRESMTSEATLATQALEAYASTTLSTPLSSNDNDVEQNSFHLESSEETASGTKHVVAGATLNPIPNDLSHAVNGLSEGNQVTLSTESTLRASPLPRGTTPPPTPPALNTTKLFASRTKTASSLSQEHTTLGEVWAKHRSHDRAVESSVGDNMIFGSGSSKPGAAQRRRNLAHTNAVTEEEADLTSKDRAKQKEAVKRFLSENVREDWTWQWPRSAIAFEPVSEPHGETVRGLWKEGWKEGWKERDEWSDNASEGGSDRSPDKNVEKAEPHIDAPDPFRFYSLEGVPEALKKVEIDRRRRRKKRLAEEMKWNDGLRCWSERRDAWTGARHVSRAPHHGFTTITKLATSASSEDGGSPTALEQEDVSDWETETEIPIAPPFIPPENGMRRSITPANYNTIYDKVVLNQMSPLCPINLRDITKSCVRGWQRDGEWAPPATTTASGGARRSRKMSVAALFGINSHEDREKEREKAKDKATAPKTEPEKRTESPSTGIRGKLGKILHLRRDSQGSVHKE